VKFGKTLCWQRTQAPVDTENIFSYLGQMERFKGYWVSGSALMTFGYGNDWYARGGVCIVEASGHTIEIKRFESREVFTSRKKRKPTGSD